MSGFWCATLEVTSGGPEIIKGFVTRPDNDVMFTCSLLFVERTLSWLGVGVGATPTEALYQAANHIPKKCVALDEFLSEASEQLVNSVG